jgi:putative membrane protein
MAAKTSPDCRLPTEQDELSQRRTGLAYQRTLLAEERTFAAWVRTGLASAAAGLGIDRLLADFEPRWLVLTIATILVITGGSIYILALWRYIQGYRAMREACERTIAVEIVGALILALLATTVLALVLAFML